ncbi:MAG TPA: hypothetical protein ENI33_07350 [Thermoplasmatales archaeon]|nr:hypothetical protein [Thermoplasmatales archaeon]
MKSGGNKVKLSLFLFLILTISLISFEKIDAVYGEEGGNLFFKSCCFNPFIGEPHFPPELKIMENESKYFIIQIEPPVNKSKLDILQKNSAKLIEYIPDYAYIAKLDYCKIKKVEEIPFVLWVGIYHPAYKMYESLLNERGKVKLNIKVFEEYGNCEKVANEIRSIGGKILEVEEKIHIIRAEVNSSLIKKIAFIPEVEWMEKAGEKFFCMDILRNLTGASLLHINGYNGTGIVGEVKDAGYDRNHSEFAGQIIGEDGNIIHDAHGTCTFGILFAKGINERARGMLPGAEGIFCDWNIGRYKSIENMVNNWSGIFQSNSWMEGNDYGDYTTYSEENDMAVYDFDVTMIYAAGNYGGSGIKISSDSNAKNVICVGGINHYNTSTRDDDEWSDASVGPSNDGRIKPDLSCAYDYIYTTDSTGSLGYADGDYFEYFGGTSGATPIVAGAVGLVYQMYTNNHFGNNPDGKVPHASTVKALLINHAYQYPFSQATRYEQGRGFVDIGAVYNNQSDFIIDGEYSLSTGESMGWNFSVNGSKPIKVTLVWTDVPGAVSSSKHLKNDLSLKVIDSHGNIYWGNYGLINSTWSSPNGTEDHTNNVENVFIQNPLDGQYRVEVIATNVVEPIENPIQNFSLVISGNVIENEPPYIPSNPFPENGSVNVSIYSNLSWKGGDIDKNDTVTYEIYFGNSPEYIESIGPYPANFTNITWKPSKMNYSENYYWKIVAVDSHGAHSISPLWSFRTEPDLVPPKILGIEHYPEYQEAGKWVNISALIEDNDKIKDVFLNITFPDLTYENFSIKQNKTENKYYCNRTYNVTGKYHFFIWVNDSAGNSNKSSLNQFSIIIPYSDVNHITISYESGFEIPNQSICTNLSFKCTASAYNETGDFIDFVPVEWHILNNESNATLNASYGKIVKFYSGELNGTATLNAKYGWHNDSVVFTINSCFFSFILYQGWNLITLPCENNYNASSLYPDIEGCSIILGWNTSKQDFDIYVPGSPYDFAIEDGHGYFIGMNHDSIFSMYDIPIQQVNVSLSAGWNCLGWFREKETNASLLYNKISNTTIILLWNTTKNDFYVYVPGSPYNFAIKRGEGFFVAVDEQSIWHGEG